MTKEEIEELRASFAARKPKSKGGVIVPWHRDTQPLNDRISKLESEVAELRKMLEDTLK